MSATDQPASICDAHRPTHLANDARCDSTLAEARMNHDQLIVDARLAPSAPDVIVMDSRQ